MRSFVPLPLTAFALLAGICSTLLFSKIPSLVYVWLIGLVAGLIFYAYRHLVIRALCIVALGSSLMMYHINQHTAHSLPEALEGQKINIVGSISSVVYESKNDTQQFLFKVINSGQPGAAWLLPAQLRLSWNKATEKLQPGDTWALQVKIRRVRNYQNPGSFDSEKNCFMQRINGLGYVIANGTNQLLQRNFFAGVVNRVRQYFFAALHQTLIGHRFANLIIALVLGIKRDIDPTLLGIMQDTGTAHLMAISGLHLGIISGVCFFLLRIMWRYAPQKLLNIPAPWVAACGALCVSCCYAIVAGFTVATQRAVLMILVFLCGILFKRKVNSTQSFCLALLLVLLFDPFAVLSMGFWFSFTAVGFLLFAVRKKTNCRSKVAIFWSWCKPQMLIASALLPITLLFFGKSSIIGPLANTLAIPWVSCAVLPVSLCGMLLLPMLPKLATILLKIAAQNLAYLWPILAKLAAFPTYAWLQPEKNLAIIIVCAMLGAIWLWIPRGLPGRYWGMLGFVPLIFVHVVAIPDAQAEFTLLDVGQGLATVIQTKQHVLVYDTGAKLQDNFDLGSKVVAPFLQAKGIKQIDLLMISHADNDHIGGAAGLLTKISAAKVMTSDLQNLTEFKPILCAAGQHWEWDGVLFTVLHPDSDAINNKRNDRSCVLMVQAGQHKALLTGDIEKRSEKQLLARYGMALQADLMLVPHHGSKTSSSWEFLQTVRPKFALIPAGYKNQYGHPKEQVLQRYRALNIATFSTAQDGAISFRLGGDLMPHCYSRVRHRFWLH